MHGFNFNDGVDRGFLALCLAVVSEIPITSREAFDIINSRGRMPVAARSCECTQEQLDEVMRKYRNKDRFFYARRLRICDDNLAKMMKSRERIKRNVNAGIGCGYAS